MFLSVSARHLFDNQHLYLSSGPIYSEKFLVKVFKEGFSSYIGKANNSATLFTVRPHLFSGKEFAFDIRHWLKGFPFFLLLFFFLFSSFVCFFFPSLFGIGLRRSEEGPLSSGSSHTTGTTTLHRIIEEAAQSDIPAPACRRSFAAGRATGRWSSWGARRRGRTRIPSQVVSE